MSNNRVEESKMSGLAKSLTALEKFGKGRYNDQIAKLDEFAEKISGFANKANGGRATVKQPFLHVAKMPENQRNIEKPLAQLSDDLFKTKELFDSKPELFSKSEQAELKDTFKQIQIEGDRSVFAPIEAFKGNIGMFMEKSTGLKSPETKTDEILKAAGGFEDKLSKKGGELDFTKDNALADFKKEVSRLAGGKHTDIDFQAKKEGRMEDFNKSVRNYAKDFQNDLKTVEDKFRSGQLKLNPRESAKFELMFDKLQVNKDKDVLIDKAFGKGKFSPNVAKPSNVKEVKPVIQGNLNKSISSPNLSKGFGGR